MTVSAGTFWSPVVGRELQTRRPRLSRTGVEVLTENPVLSACLPLCLRGPWVQSSVLHLGERGELATALWSRWLGQGHRASDMSPPGASHRPAVRLPAPGQHLEVLGWS